MAENGQKCWKVAYYLKRWPFWTEVTQGQVELFSAFG